MTNPIENSLIQMQKGCDMLAESARHSFRARKLGITKEIAIKERIKSIPNTFSNSQKMLVLAMVDIAYNASNEHDAYQNAYDYAINYANKEIAKQSKF